MCKKIKDDIHKTEIKLIRLREELSKLMD
jgi:hypothetical protein